MACGGPTWTHASRGFPVHILLFINCGEGRGAGAAWHVAGCGRGERPEVARPWVAAWSEQHATRVPQLWFAVMPCDKRKEQANFC